MTELAIIARPTALTRARSWVVRALGGTVAPPERGASAGETAPEYSVETSLSAFAAFPLVRACADAIATDIASLPLIARRGKGSKAERIDEHSALALLEQPTSWQGREEWERQVVTYLLLSGNAYALDLGGQSLPLLHPEAMRVEADIFCQPAAYIFGEKHLRYMPEQVLHWRLSSWRDGAQGLLGTGLIQALHADLDADLAASKLTARQAKRERPAAILAPKDGGEWDKDTRDQVVAVYSGAVSANKAAIALSNAVDLTFPNLTPRDLEFGVQRALTRGLILAAFGVPPVRVGYETANYATAREQNKVYWQGLVGLARILNAPLTRWARRTDPSIRIEHDFSGVEALQESRTERLNRVLTWTMLGATEADAAAYEGFEDAPVEAVDASLPTTPGANAVEPAPDAPPASAERDLGHLFLVRGETAPDQETQRAALWHGWIERAHKPAELRMQRATRAALKAQAVRVAGRLPANAASIRRDLVSDLLALLWPEEAERKAMESALREGLAKVLADANRAAAGEVGGTAWTSSRLDEETMRQLAALVTRINDTTRDALRVLLADGVAQGAAVSDLQASIMRAAAFGPSRALLVARTESTRAISAGSMAAYQDASDQGVEVEVEWLSARDGSVRDTHRALDGQRVAVGERFRARDGDTARYPGDFAKVANDANCRCAVVPRVV